MFALKKLITPFLLPPGILIVFFCIMGWWGFRRKNRPTYLCMLISTVFLWLISISPVCNLLMSPLESGLTIPQQPDGDVIIVLAGSLYPLSPDLSGSGAPGPATMERMVTGARLHRKLDLPIILSGDVIYSPGATVGKITKRFLIDLGISPQAVILEERSRDTYENALYAKAICDRFGYTRPIVVTSGYHLKRAMLCFKSVGLDAIPFPCAISTWPDIEYNWQSYLPNAGALKRSSAALHEMIGLFYYRMRY